MVGKFAIKHFCGALVEGWRFIFFLGGPLDALEVYDNERSVSRKERRLEMCRKTYWRR